MKVILVCVISIFSEICFCQFTKEELNQLAIDRYNVADFKGAENYFSMIIAQYPNDSIAYLDRGMMKEFMKDFQGAIDDFSKQILVDSTSVDGYFLRAINEEKLGFYSKALTDYKRVIDLEYGNSDAHLYCGRIYKKMKQKKEALLEFNNALAINNENAQALIERGWFYAMEKKYKLALLDLNQAISIDSTLVRAFECRGWVKAEINDFSGAILDYQSMISLNPFGNFEYYQPARHLLRRFNRVLNKIEFDELSGYDQLLFAYLNLFLKRMDQAKIILEDPRISSEYLPYKMFGLAKFSFLEQKNMKNTLSYLDSAIKYFTDQPELFRFKAEVYLKIGNIQEACSNYEHYKLLTKDFKHEEFFNSCANILN